MRTVIVTEFISLDGVIEAPGGEEGYKHTGWTFDIEPDPTMYDFKLAEAREVEALLLGRRTYEGFAGAWPERETAGEEDADFAKTLGDMRKIVVSNQQLEFTWRNSELLEGDLVGAVTELKHEPGDGTISMSGSVSVIRQLLGAGLLDELHLLVHPIAIRKGMRLFDEGEAPIPLKLISSETFVTGVLNLVYAPSDAPGSASYQDAKGHLSQPEA